MEDVIIPYELPDVENHSFFFIDQRIDTQLEAKLHQHDAWELYCVVQGRGTRTRNQNGRRHLTDLFGRRRGTNPTLNAPSLGLRAVIGRR